MALVRISLIFFCMQTGVFAQITPICKRVKLTKDVFLLDTLTVLPATIYAPAYPQLAIVYSLATGKARFEGNLPEIDSLTLCYQRLPTNLTGWVGKRDIRIADTTSKYWDELLERTKHYTPPREQLVELKDFQKSGNFVRGLSLGNTQNVFVNSALNLQLEGKITEDITLTATISDQQIPYQPEGNTLQLQDLDRVFMRFAHKQGSLTAGEIVLQNKDNHFLKFYKNTQGGFLETHYKIGKHTAHTFAGIAVARGKFYSATLEPIEGVQGPYRLKGPNGELFIIVLANTERVFIDGKPLQRGYNYDYIIDYNLGEITFNSHVLITRFTRLRVDFEYAERNYTRTILTFGHEQKTKNARLLTQLYREGDNPNNSLTKLRDDQKAQLRYQTAGIGLINGVDSIAYNPNDFLYKRIDSTTINGTYSAVLVYSTTPQNAFYKVSFIQVGIKKGDYVRVNNNLNGQVYKWVEPLNGEKQGDYAPLKAIPLPNKKQLMVVSSSYNLSENAKVFADMGISSQNNNAFSDLPAASLTGIATRIGYQNTGKSIQDSSRYVAFGGINYEYNQAKFTPIDRFRSIEFDRDWSKNIDSSRLDDHILQTEIGIKNKKNSLFSYKFVARNRAYQVNGWQQAGIFQHQFKRISVQGNVFFLDSRQDSLHSFWQRWQGEVQYKTRYITPSYRWNGDKNRLVSTLKDSIVSSAMYFEAHTFGIKSADSLRLKYDISYSLRADKAPYEGQIIAYLNAETLSLQTTFTTKKQQSFLLTAVYRKATVNSNFPLQNAQSGENLQGRLDWNGAFNVGKNKEEKDGKGVLSLRSELSLTTSTGQELQRAYYFLLVAVGQGTHTWRDDNGNGLQELNEFYLAINPDERKYAKIFRPTSDYIPAFAQTLTYRLNWQTFKNNDKKATNGLLSGLLSWNVSRRFTQNNIWARLIPVVAVTDSSLLSEQAVLRSTVFFNRNHLRYSGELTYQNTEQKQLLINGFEAKNREEIRASWRNRVGEKWTLQTQATFQTQKNTSDFLENRNFTLKSYQFSPEWAYQTDNTKRIAFGYQFSYKLGNNINESALPARVHQMSIEARYSKVSRRILSVNGRFLRIAYTGERNSPLAYDILEALQVGTNFTWQGNWQERLQNGLQLTFSYEGRKSANSPLVHLGRAQVGLLF